MNTNEGETDFKNTKEEKLKKIGNKPKDDTKE